jgi:hypothetical protein
MYSILLADSYPQCARTILRDKNFGRLINFSWTMFRQTIIASTKHPARQVYFFAPSALFGFFKAGRTPIPNLTCCFFARDRQKNNKLNADALCRHLNSYSNQANIVNLFQISFPTFKFLI